MKTHIKLYLIKGYWWWGFELNGKLYILNKIGRQYDCIRP